jgi:hypothetical protein
MKKTAYILNYYGRSVAVIFADSETELKEKLTDAIKEEVCADNGAQFSLALGRIGDWGEDTDIKTSYVNDGELIEDNEFTLVKTVSY